MLKWDRHYTGLYAERAMLGMRLWCAKELNGTWRMFRLSRGKVSVGVHLNSQNYGRVLAQGGWQLFVSGGDDYFHLGRARRVLNHRRRVLFSGSLNAPYTAFTVRLGRWLIGAKSPPWLVRRKEREQQEWAAGVRERRSSR